MSAGFWLKITFPIIHSFSLNFVFKPWRHSLITFMTVSSGLQKKKIDRQNFSNPFERLSNKRECEVAVIPEFLVQSNPAAISFGEVSQFLGIPVKSCNNRMQKLVISNYNSFEFGINIGQSEKVFQLVMGPGQRFLARVESSWDSCFWFGFG